MTLDVLLAALAASIAFTSLVWLVSLPLRDASIMDVAWGPGFLVAAGAAGWMAGQGTGRAWMVTAMVALWAVRLALHILVRALGKPEDPRYARWRRQAGRSWWWRSWFKVFLLQGVILVVVALPVIVQVVAVPTGLTAFDMIGALVWASGFAIETVADWQLRRFRKGRPESGEVLDTGLWAWSRHPNYFGETLVWWGLGIMALSVEGGLVALVGPALITWLILRVSGVAMLESLQAETKPAYADYVRRTSAFIPRPPRPRDPVRPEAPPANRSGT